MNITAKLRAAQLPKVIADLKYANQFLKIFALASLTLCFASIVLAIVLVSKGPHVIALAPSGETLSLDSQPNPERDVEMALRKYISLRYTWDSKNIRERLGLARVFVNSNALKSFDSDLAEVQKFAIDRNASQHGYVAEISIDLTKQVAHIQGDRVTTIQGLTAAGALVLSLQFESGPRTKANPWGIYVSKERNE